MDAALLDTDILSEGLKQRNAAVATTAAYLQDQCRFATFCQHSPTLPVTDPVFHRAADLWVTARQGAHPYGDADLLIAATALEYGRVLVTGNPNHFAWIPGLTVTGWRRP